MGSAGLRAGGSFNLGRPEDYRVPDLGYHRGSPDHLYFPTAALVVEFLSPDDETFAKSGFYARHGVDELWIVDPVARTVRIRVLSDGAYDERDTSAMLGLSAVGVADDVDWP